MRGAPWERMVRRPEIWHGLRLVDDFRTFRIERLGPEFVEFLIAYGRGCSPQLAANKPVQLKVGGLRITRALVVSVLTCLAKMNSEVGTNRHGEGCTHCREAYLCSGRRETRRVT
jgi:hypothetical protein